jgi:hypothetical protein
MSSNDLRQKLQKEIEFLKSQGHDRAAIEERFGYSANYLDQALVRPTEKVYKSILLYKDWVLCNTMLKKEGGPGSESLPDKYKTYQSNFDRLAVIAEKNTDTINKMAEAHLVMTNAMVNSGETDAASLTLREKELLKGLAIQDADPSDKSESGSAETKGRQKNIFFGRDR